MGLLGAMVLLQPVASAETESEPAAAEGETAAEIEEESGSQRADPQRIRRLRRRGIILTVIGLALTGGGAAMSAYGFSGQDDDGDAALRPLSIVFLGLGLALSGVGISDVVTSYLEDDRDDDEAVSFRLFDSYALALTPRLLQPLL